MMTNADRSSGAQRETELVYRAQINKVLAYLQAHLDDAPNLERLACVAGFSPYHFHRIFAAFVGEPVGQYVRRLRLEGAARILRTSRQPVTQIALSSGYESPSAFTKAFKQHFGISPTQWRTSLHPQLRQADRPSAPTILQASITQRYLPRSTTDMTPEIRTLPDLEVLYVRRTGETNNDFTQAAKSAFFALHQFAEANGVADKWQYCLGITPDDPGTVPSDAARYDAGFVLKEGVTVKPSGEAAFQTLPGGKWAVFMHIGPYHTLGETWDAAYREWLPSSGETLRDAPPFEVYLDDNQTSPAELRTEVYIPIH